MRAWKMERGFLLQHAAIPKTLAGSIQGISRFWSGVASLQTSVEGVKVCVAQRQAQIITDLEEMCTEQWATTPATLCPNLVKTSV